MAQMNRCSLFLTFGLIVTSSIFAQDPGSSQSVEKKIMLSGRVYDTNGALVMRSDVLARSAGGQEYQGRTNSEGIYKMEVPLGIYKIEANAEGFCPKRVELALVQRIVESKKRIFRVSNSGRGQNTVDFVLEISSPATIESVGSPCKQKTMIKKDPPKKDPDTFRRIADQILARNNGRTSR
ncbi:MAG: hypothetical protein QOG23_4523 [Blastocatellia bacterium]|nr:hypothetical protein [Blastocatellia bacterium]